MVLVVASAAAGPRLKELFSPRTAPLEKLATVPVRRTDMHVTLTTGGKVESSERTLIECELERLELSVKGQAMVGGGASTVLSVVPDGTMVKAGEVLCRLDSSEYEEMLRQQKMTVKRAVADHRQAELDLDVARLAVAEFKDGTLQEALKELSGLIALNQSAWERSKDRLKWALRMRDKGYIPLSQVGNEEINQRRAEFLWKQSRAELEVFERFSVPRALRALEGQVLMAEATLRYQDQRLKRHREREEMLRLQVDRCTIRAPHDGFVIYANNDDRQIKIEEGMVVRQRQDLFYLPNLTKMMAMALVHESVASRIRPGMKTRVRVEGLPGRVLDGHVASVAHLPTQNYFNEVRYFYTEVVLDTIPRGLRPGMTAEVEVATERREDVLAIPIEALAVENGRDFCYVAQDNRVERREIAIGQATSALLEVTAGLEEGELVVLDPDQFDDKIETLSPFDPEFESLAAETRAR
jgi:HlyD family secretion protein